MKVLENISYSSIGHERQVLDVYLPDCEEFPVFVYFHGGGFEAGSKGDDRNNAIGIYLASKGIACVCANYRMYPDAVYPEYLKDCAAAVAWTFKHIAEYGKCDKVFVGGTSAGAYASMMLNYDKKWLAPHRIKIMDIAGFLHDAGQPTTHFNVLQYDRGIDRRRIVVDEAAPLYYIGIEPEYPPQRHLVSTNDIPGRHVQLNLVLEAMRHFEYDMSKVDIKVFEGKHSRYTEVKLEEVIEEFVRENL